MRRLLLFLLVLLPFAPGAARRWARERGDRAVTLCVDGADVAALFPPAARPAVLRDLHQRGVTALAVYVLPGGSAADAAAPWAGLPAGMTLTLRPVFKKASDGGLPVDAEALAAAPGVRHLLPAGPYLPGPGPASAPHRLMAETDWLLAWPEFSRGPAWRALTQAFPDRLLRAHAVEEDELQKLSPAAAAARFRRAARERGVRFLYLRFFPGRSADENLAFVSALASGLRADGFSLTGAAPRAAAARRSPPIRPLVAWLIAVLAPLALWRMLAAAAVPWWARPLLWALGAAAAGLAAAGALSAPDNGLGLAPFRGVKAALSLPLVILPFFLWTREERRAFLGRPLTVGVAVAGAVLAFAAGLYLLRSGNEGAAAASGFEMRLRGLLEAVFGVRPRFKEFAIGHPLLWLGAWLSARGRDGRFFLWTGLLAPVSIINSFSHAHVPIAVSLERTLHGAWLGALLGLGAVALAGKRLCR